MTQKLNRVESVERALLILDAFKQGEAVLSLAELAIKTGLYKSTILRLIGTLEYFGYIKKTPTGGYRLGVSVFQLGLLYKSSFDLERYIRPVLKTLVEKTNETAAYYVRAGYQRQCLYRVNSPRSARHHLEEGSLLPLEVGATGRVLLAYTNGAEEDCEVKRSGFYISLGERDPDVAAVAVPVLGQTGEIYGALSVSGLRSRFDQDKRKKALVELQLEAKALSYKLNEEGGAFI